MWQRWLLMSWQKKALAFLLVYLILTIAGLLYFVRPNYLRHVAAHQQLHTWQQQLISLNALSAQWHQLAKEDGLQDDINEKNILSILAASAKQAGVTIMSLVPTADQQHQHQLLIGLKANANYFAWLAWLQHWQAQRLPVSIKSFVVSAGADDPAWLAIEMQLMVWVAI